VIGETILVQEETVISINAGILSQLQVRLAFSQGNLLSWRLTIALRIKTMMVADYSSKISRVINSAKSI
jgi:hypothetical protein